MRLKKAFLGAMFALFSLPVFSQGIIPLELTEDSRISMLTCSPGEDLYSVFGHSAIRVSDPNLNLDMIFNYGTFDFSTPNFYFKFVKGRLDYILSVSDLYSFVYEYMAEQRWVTEQVLDIGLEERQFLFDSLRINYLPENRMYRYDFFFDNCATRIRDIFYEGIDSLVYQELPGEDFEKSFRELIDPYVSHMPWIKLGINVALGSLADRKASEWERMFLPDHMLDHFRYTRLNTKGSPLLCYPEVVLIAGREPASPKMKIHDPMVVLWMLFILGMLLTWLDIKRNRTTRWFDVILFGTAGLFGLLLLFLWFGTDHTVMVKNYNLLWAIPLHVPAVLLIVSGKAGNIVKKYFFLTSTLLLLVIVLWRILPQELPLPLLPLILLMVIRAFLIFKKYKAD